MFCDMVGLGVIEAFAELEAKGEEWVARAGISICFLRDYLS